MLELSDEQLMLRVAHAQEVDAMLQQLVRRHTGTFWMYFTR